MKKLWIPLVLSVLCLGLFTACTSNADTLPSATPSVSVAPVVTPSMTVAATEAPTASASPTAGGVNTIEDAARVSEAITKEVEKLSELKMVEAVAAGNIALVGIAYDAQYQGGLTDRMIQMVDERVQTVDKTITTVHVTDDAAMVEKIKTLREQLDKKEITFEQLQTQMLDIGSQVNSTSAGTGKPTDTTTGTGTGTGSGTGMTTKP
ncbi:MAG: YhcN/YlaJ family sporulation lipoprotein [Clostridia bacterium]